MDETLSDSWQTQRAAVAAYLRAQREISNMSLRELSRVTHISNAYLSQVERGLHDPTLRVLWQIGDALQVSMADIIGVAATAPEPAAHSAASAQVPPVETAIRADPYLAPAEKEALLTVYRTYRKTEAKPAE